MKQQENYNLAKVLIDNQGSRAEEAQVYATLAIVDELRAIRELLTPPSERVVKIDDAP